MKKILVSVMTIALVVAIAGAGFAAYFSDTETSENNTFTAGTLDLVLGGSDGNAIWVSPTNWAPAETTSGTITFENAGSVDIGWIGIKPVNVTVVGTTPVDFPEKIIVKGFSMVDTLSGKSIGVGDPDAFADFMATWGCWGSAAPLTLAEFASGDYYFYTEPSDWLLTALNTTTTSLTMEFEFDSEADDTYQGAICNFELRVKVLQYNATLDDFVHMGDACGYAPGQ